MKVEDLAMIAVKNINQATSTGLEGLRPQVIVRMPPSKRESATRRMVPQGKCPIGRVISRMEDYDVVTFDAVDVLAWCVAVHGWKIEEGEG